MVSRSHGLVRAAPNRQLVLSPLVYLGSRHPVCSVFGFLDLVTFTPGPFCFAPKQRICSISICIFLLGRFVLQCVTVKWAKAHTLTGLSLHPHIADDCA